MYGRTLDLARAVFASKSDSWIQDLCICKALNPPPPSARALVIAQGFDESNRASHHLSRSYLTLSLVGGVANRSSQQQEVDGGGLGMHSADISDMEDQGKEDSDGEDSYDDGSELESNSSSDSDYVEPHVYRRKIAGGANGGGGGRRGGGGGYAVDGDCTAGVVSPTRVTRYRKREQKSGGDAEGARSQRLLPSSVNTPIKEVFAPAKEVRSVPCANGGNNDDNNSRLGSDQELQQGSVGNTGGNKRKIKGPYKKKEKTPQPQKQQQYHYNRKRQQQLSCEVGEFAVFPTPPKSPVPFLVGKILEKRQVPVPSSEMAEKTEILLHWFSPKIGRVSAEASTMPDVEAAASVKVDMAFSPEGTKPLTNSETVQVSQGQSSLASTSAAAGIAPAMKYNDSGTAVTFGGNVQSGTKALLSLLENGSSIKHVDSYERSSDVNLFEEHPVAESSKSDATYCPASAPGGAVPSPAARRLRAAATAAVQAGEIAATYGPGRWSGDFVPGPPGRGLVRDTGTEDLRAAMVLFPRLLKSSSVLPSKVRKAVREAVEEAAATAAAAEVVAAAATSAAGVVVVRQSHET